MIKRLRIKLIAVSMLSLFVVLSVIMGVLNVLSYTNVVTKADETLYILADNNGNFPKGMDKPSAEKDKKPKKSEKKDNNEKENSPELPYESRYFWVLLGDDGKVISTNTGKIAAINTKTANKLAQDVFASNNTYGFKDEYRYIVCDESNQKK